MLCCICVISTAFILASELGLADDSLGFIPPLVVVDGMVMVFNGTFNTG